MTDSPDPSDQKANRTTQILQLLAELLVFLGLILLLEAATTALVQWIGNEYRLGHDLFGPDSRLNDTLMSDGYSQSPVVYALNHAVRLGVSTFVLIVVTWAVGILLGGTGKLWPYVRTTIRGLMVALAINIPMGAVVGFVFDMKSDACHYSLMYGTTTGFSENCPLGPDTTLPLLLGSVAVLALIGLMVYTISRAHQFALWRAIATLALGSIVLAIFQSIYTAVGFGG